MSPRRQRRPRSRPSRSRPCSTSLRIGPSVGRAPKAEDEAAVAAAESALRELSSATGHDQSSPRLPQAQRLSTGACAHRQWLALDVRASRDALLRDVVLARPGQPASTLGVGALHSNAHAARHLDPCAWRLRTLADVRGLAAACTRASERAGDALLIDNFAFTHRRCPRCSSRCRPSARVAVPPSQPPSQPLPLHATAPTWTR